MEPNIFRYIWRHTRREQIIIVLVIALSMIPYYLAFDLPKQIVNGPLLGTGFEAADNSQPFMRLSFDIPWVGTVHLSDGIELTRVPLLMALSLTFLALVIVNGLFKYAINTRKGRMGERLLRRIRYELVDRILRFPPARLRQAKAGEISSMVKDEVEPLGGFAGDAFTQPAMLGGQALTAMVFIFMQHFWLGMVAAAMAAIQVAIIPRMRRRLIVLGRQRQVTAREFAGRVTEIVDGIQTIHANDATNWERADIVSRLGRIFRIRYDIYQWKFLVKFLNNFIAQLTPFLFYSIGGYLTIRGTLDVGQLVAVINAYKELPGPLKELIDWDLARQDMQVKYEQVVEQFEADGLIDPARQDIDALAPAGSYVPLAVRNLTVRSDVGTVLLDDVTLEVAQGQTLAVIGGSADGAPILGEILGGAMVPSMGGVQLGTHDLRQMPENATGRMLGYAGSTIHLFSGSVLDNLTYGLKRRPAMSQDEAGADWQWEEARRAGNPVLDPQADWIDHGAVQPAPGAGGLIDSICAVLDVVGLTDDVITFAVRARIDPALVPLIAEDVLAIRYKLRERLKDRDLASVVLPFEAGRYNDEATIAENLLFGVPNDPETSVTAIISHPFFRETLGHTGLTTRLFDLGWQFAKVTVDLFDGMMDDPGALQSLTYMTPEEMPEFEQILTRTQPGDFDQARSADRVRLIRLAMSYVERKYRFGLLDDGLRGMLVAGRQALAERVPAELHGQLQPYEAHTYLRNATLLENILFGKINRRFGHAEDRIAEVVRGVIREAFAAKPALRDRIMAVGLGYDIGPGGRRLATLQRQKLALARVLIRKSAFYVFNEPLAGIDPGFQDRMIGSILGFLATRPEPPGVIWVLANKSLLSRFSSVAEFARGRLVAPVTVCPPTVPAVEAIAVGRGRERA